MSQPKNPVSAKEAARIASVHIGTIYRLVKRGRLRAYKRAGSRYVLDREDVEALTQLVEVVPGGVRT